MFPGKSEVQFVDLFRWEPPFHLYDMDDRPSTVRNGWRNNKNGGGNLVYDIKIDSEIPQIIKTPLKNEIDEL